VNSGVLQAAGPAAASIAEVGWVLIIGAGLIFAGVMFLLVYALRRHAPQLRAGRWIAGGGVIFPLVVLVSLFVWTVPLSSAWRPVPPAGALVITVTARMWWWEVKYPGANELITSNEIHVPVGRPVYLALASSDVIHSFWVPELAGKMDMVPGRLQHLLVQADRPGVYRGQCAEYCGEQHALMALHVVAESPEAFDAWRRAQAQPAQAPATPQLVRGRDAFLAQRCDACHIVRGVTKEARLGPDLTHVGSRLHLAAGTLRNSSESLAHWVAHVQDVKPGARMPSYERLDRETLAALADWLASLR
jgi:cytochrome c oxidase subunit II